VKLRNGAGNAERGEKKNKNFLLANKKKVLTFAVPNKTGRLRGQKRERAILDRRLKKDRMDPSASKEK